MNAKLSSRFENWFDVIFERQTWLNLFYLFLSFPLGIALFVMTVTGISVGAGTAVIGVGFLVFALLFLILRGVAALERQLVGGILGRKITPAQPKAHSREGIGRILDLVLDPYTWRTVAYALIRFPLGIASFVVAVTAVSIPAGMISAPFTYPFGDLHIGLMIVDTLPEAIVAATLGVLLAPIALHVVNLFAHFSGLVTAICLGQEVESVEDAIEILKSAEKSA